MVLLLVFQFSKAQKQPIMPSDYEKWGTLIIDKTSQDANWITYVMRYDSAGDTLFVQNTNSLKRYSFPNANQTLFSSNNRMVAITTGSNVTLLNLVTGIRQNFLNTNSISFLANNNIAIMQEVDNVNQVIVTNENGEKILSTTGTLFKTSNTGDIAVSNENEITIFQKAIYNKKQVITLDSIQNVKNICWNHDGTKLAVLAESKDNGNLSIQVSEQNKALKFISPMFTSQLTEHNIVDEGPIPIFFSEDGNSLYFYYNSNPPINEQNSLVEIWDSNSVLEYSEMAVKGSIENHPKIAVWNLLTNQINKIATNQSSGTIITPDYKYALTYSDVQEKNFTGHNAQDYYITNLESGEKTPFLKKHISSPTTFSASPTGQHLAYYTSGHLWIYDLRRKSYFQFTENSNQSKKTQTENNNVSFNRPLWTSNGDYVAFESNGAVWLASIKSKSATRITGDNSSNMKYKILDNLYFKEKVRNPAIGINASFNLQKGLLIEGKNENKSTGIFIWDAINGLKKVLYQDAKIDRIAKSTTSNHLLFVLQRYDLPPQIKKIESTSTEARLVFQSNPHYALHNAQKAELLEYRHKSNQKLYGALYYPSNFELGKKYPMIIYIYEKLSYRYHEYSNPSQFHRIGFPIANYTNDGYFVLLPDIAHSIGNPGVSILESVQLGVSQVLEKRNVDPFRIGLLGHSYGGYEVANLVTQTNTFAAAVSGSAVTNMISSYLTLDAASGKSRQWRFEADQYRMGVSLFDDMDAYLKHSPVVNADKIETPLLSWTGKQDFTVHWEQSIQLHLAMRRLGKNHKLLVYPSGSHILYQKEAQYDLTWRIKEWFNTYLKNK